MPTRESDLVINSDTDSKEKGGKVSLGSITKLVEDHNKKAIPFAISTKEPNRKYRSHGFQPPFHFLQVLTWILYALRQVYMVIYVLAAISNDFSVTALTIVSVLHITLTIAVVLLAVAVTISDGQYT